jgi:AcrR family transcriptional regulator
MSTRGPYAKGIERRGEILDAALRVIAAEGYAGATVAAIADAVQMSPNGLLHHFASKDELLVEALRRRDELDSDGVDERSLTAALDDHDPTLDELAEPLLTVVRRNSEIAGLVRLFTHLAAEGVDDGHAAHDFFAERYTRLRRMLAAAVAHLQRSGSVRTDVAPEHAAALVLAAIDGLQTQWLYDDSVDMPAHLSALLRLLSTPEEGP